MASLCKITLIGNLGRDPEVRDFKGTKVVSFSLAVNENYTKSTGEKVEKTDWFKITFWGGGLADVAEKYLQKGSQVYVEGRLSTGEYTDKEGKNRTSLEVRAQNLVLLGSRPEQSGTQEQMDANATIQENFPSNVTEDDLPF